MAFDLNQIPTTVAGTEPQPKLYGRSANQRYYDLTQAAQDEFQRSGDDAPLEKINQASIRYTPEGTIAKGHVTEEALENAIGYAEADIEHFDRNGDQALSAHEVSRIFAQPFQQRIAHLQTVVDDPQTSQAQKRQALQEQRMLAVVGERMATAKAANFFKAVDVRDANGHSDGKLTADELAAKALFDDAALDMFADNHESYRTMMDALQAKTDYDGPSFQELSDKIATIRAKDHRHPLAMDGQITAEERELSDALVDAPIPTNRVVSAIHKALDLKARAANAEPE